MVTILEYIENHELQQVMKQDESVKQKIYNELLAKLSEDLDE